MKCSKTEEIPMGPVQIGGLRSSVKVGGYVHRHLDTDDLLSLIAEDLRDSLSINDLIDLTSLDTDTVQNMVNHNIHQGYLEMEGDDHFTLTEDGSTYLGKILDGRVDPAEEIDDNAEPDDDP